MKQTCFLAGLKMAAHAAATRDLRYYLNGVFIEWNGVQLTLVGTDGHRCAVAQLNYGSAPLPDGKHECITVPHSQVKLLLSLPKTSGDVEISFLAERVATFAIAGQLIAVEGVAGKFPDWRRVAPEAKRPSFAEGGVSAIGFCAPYVAEACAALAKVANKKYKGVKLHLTGPDEVMRFEANLAGDHPSLTNAYVCVMPMRL